MQRCHLNNPPQKAVGNLKGKAGPALYWILTCSKVVQAEQHARQRPEHLSSAASVQSSTLGTPMQQLKGETATAVHPMYHHSPGQSSGYTTVAVVPRGATQCLPLGRVRAEPEVA